MEDYTIERARLLAAAAAGYNDAVAAQLRESGSSTATGTATSAAMEAFHHRYLPLSVGTSPAGSSLPYLGGMLAPPTSPYRAPSGGLVSMRSFWPPTPPPDAYSRSLGSYYPLFSPTHLAPGSTEFNRLTPSHPYTHIFDKEMSFLSPTLRLGSSGHPMPHPASYLQFPSYGHKAYDPSQLQSELEALQKKDLKQLENNNVIKPSTPTEKILSDSVKKNAQVKPKEAPKIATVKVYKHRAEELSRPQVKPEPELNIKSPSPFQGNLSGVTATSPAAYSHNLAVSTSSFSPKEPTVTQTLPPCIVTATSNSVVSAKTQSVVESYNCVTSSSVATVTPSVVIQSSNRVPCYYNSQGPKNYDGSAVLNLSLHQGTKCPVSLPSKSTTTETVNITTSSTNTVPSIPSQSQSPIITRHPNPQPSYNNKVPMTSVSTTSLPSPPVCTFSSWVHHEMSITTSVIKNGSGHLHNRLTKHHSEQICSSTTTNERLSAEPRNDLQNTETVRPDSIDSETALPKCEIQKGSFNEYKGESANAELNTSNQSAIEPEVVINLTVTNRRNHGKVSAEECKVSEVSEKQIISKIVVKKDECNTLVEQSSNKSEDEPKNRKEQDEFRRTKTEYERKSIEQAAELRSKKTEDELRCKKMEDNLKTIEQEAINLSNKVKTRTAPQESVSVASLNALSRLASSGPASDPTNAWGRKVEKVPHVQVKPSSMVSSIQSEALKQTSFKNNKIVNMPVATTAPMISHDRPSVSSQSRPNLPSKDECNTLLSLQETVSSTMVSVTSSVLPVNPTIPVGIAVAQLRQDSSNITVKRSLSNSNETSSIACPQMASPDKIKPIEHRKMNSQISESNNLVNQVCNNTATISGSVPVTHWESAPSSESLLSGRPNIPNSWISPAPVVAAAPTVWVGQATPYASEPPTVTPPVGFQLARDPLSGQIFLIPAPNIEIVDRSNIWSTYTPGVQQIVTQPTTFHQQIIQQVTNGTKTEVKPCLLKKPPFLQIPTGRLEASQETKELKVIGGLNTTVQQSTVAGITVQSTQPFAFPGFTATANATAPATLSYFYEPPTILHLTQTQSSSAGMQTAELQQTVQLQSQMQSNAVQLQSGGIQLQSSGMQLQSNRVQLQSQLSQLNLQSQHVHGGIQIDEMNHQQQHQLQIPEMIKRSQGTSPLQSHSPHHNLNAQGVESEDDEEDEDSDSGSVEIGKLPSMGVTMAIQVDMDASTDNNDLEERSVEVQDSANQTDGSFSDAPKEDIEDENLSRTTHSTNLNTLDVLQATTQNESTMVSNCSTTLGFEPQLSMNADSKNKVGFVNVPVKSFSDDVTVPSNEVDIIGERASAIGSEIQFCEISGQDKTSLEWKQQNILESRVEPKTNYSPSSNFESNLRSKEDSEMSSPERDDNCLLIVTEPSPRTNEEIKEMRGTPAHQLSIESEDECPPQLPTKSHLVMDFIDHHGLDLLVDSIEEFASREEQVPGRSVEPQKKSSDDKWEKFLCESKLAMNTNNSILKNQDTELCSEVNVTEHLNTKLVVPEEEVGVTTGSTDVKLSPVDDYGIDPSCTDGLVLLCALAERRFFEETNSTHGSVSSQPHASDSYSGDISDYAKTSSHQNIIVNTPPVTSFSHPQVNSSSTSSLSNKPPINVFSTQPISSASKAPSTYSKSSHQKANSHRKQLNMKTNDVHQKQEPRPSPQVKLFSPQPTLGKTILSPPIKSSLTSPSHSKTFTFHSGLNKSFSPPPHSGTNFQKLISEDSMEYSEFEMREPDTEPKTEPKKSSGKPKKHRSSSSKFPFLSGSISDGQSPDVSHQLFELNSKTKKKSDIDAIITTSSKSSLKKFSKKSSGSLGTSSPKPKSESKSSKSGNTPTKSKSESSKKSTSKSSKLTSKEDSSKQPKKSASKEVAPKAQAILSPRTSSDSEGERLFVQFWRNQRASLDASSPETPPEFDPSKVTKDYGRIGRSLMLTLKSPSPTGFLSPVSDSNDGALDMLAECAAYFKEENTKANYVPSHDDESSDYDARPPSKKKPKLVDEKIESAIEGKDKDVHEAEEEKVEEIALTDEQKNEEAISGQLNENQGVRRKSCSLKKPREEDPWIRRRSERIFLHDAGVTLPSTFTLVDEQSNGSLTKDLLIETPKPTQASRSGDSEPQISEPKVKKLKLMKTDDQGKLKTKTKVKRDSSKETAVKKSKIKEIKKQDKSVPEDLFAALSQCRLSESNAAIGVANVGGLSPCHDEGSSSEGDVPLSLLIERAAANPARGHPSCLLTPDNLADNLRVLTEDDELYYAGYMKAIQPPDVYGIVRDGERGSRPRILSREEILNQAIMEVKPTSVGQVPEGSRVCAYWSQQYRCLYPGTVAKGTSPNPLPMKNLVFVEFDDGDSGKIPIEDVRFLPQEEKPTQTPAAANRTEDTKEDLPNDVSFALTLECTESKKAAESEVRRSSPAPLAANELIKIKTKKAKKNLLSKKLLKKQSCSSPNASDSSYRSLLKSAIRDPNKKKSKKNKLKSKLKDHSNSKSCDDGSSSRSPADESLASSSHHSADCCILSSPTDESSSSAGPLSSKSKKHKKHKSGHRHHHHKHHCHHHKKHKHDKSKNSSSYQTQQDISVSSSSDSTPKCSTVITLSPGKSFLSTSYNMQNEERDKEIFPKKTEKTMDIMSPKQISESAVISMKSNMRESNVVTSAIAESSMATLIQPLSSPESTEKKKSELTVKIKASLLDMKESAQDDPENTQNSSESDNEKSKSKSKKKKSKIAAFLPAQQIWSWLGSSFKRQKSKGRGKKEYYKAIVRGREEIQVGDSAVFLSTGRPNLPYVGRIDSMWETWRGHMVVKVVWFYHPEETVGGKKLKYRKGALYESPHVDENDVQTISHKCEVLSLGDYLKWKERRKMKIKKDETKKKRNYHSDNEDVYYLAGKYDPMAKVLTMAPGVP